MIKVYKFNEPTSRSFNMFSQAQLIDNKKGQHMSAFFCFGIVKQLNLSDLLIHRQENYLYARSRKRFLF